ncbi:MAG: cysteine hydrolase [Spirochaetes bacterium]|nr:cysteine hydrolase [Spirochaetota bacterium]
MGKTRKALIVVDMLNDFIDENGPLFCGKEARAIVPFIGALIDEYRREGGLVVYLCDSHRKDDREFDRFPPHCVTGTRGAEVIPELAPSAGDTVIRKSRYSGFYGTDLEEVLEKNGVLEVGVVGVCTSICVMDTVGGLANRDYGITVYEGGVADFDPESARCAMARMRRVYGVRVVAS